MKYWPFTGGASHTRRPMSSRARDELYPYAHAVQRSPDGAYETCCRAAQIRALRAVHVPDSVHGHFAA